jgi:hypothetical protein
MQSKTRVRTVAPKAFPSSTYCCVNALALSCSPGTLRRGTARFEELSGLTKLGYGNVGAFLLSIDCSRWWQERGQFSRSSASASASLASSSFSWMRTLSVALFELDLAV